VELAIMWIKVVIVVLFIALLISLGSGYIFLMKDQGRTRRTWNSLSVRLILAALLIGFLVYGVLSGRLGSKAPWDAYKTDAYKAPQAQPIQ
jgi:hypothetical protein